MSSITRYISELKTRWHNIARKVDHMSLRERLVLLVALLAVIYLVWWLALRLPLETKASQLMHRFKATGTQLNVLQKQAERISAEIVQPKVSKEFKQVENLEGQVQLLGNKLKTFEGKVIPYEKLADMLREVLMQEKDLQLTSIQSPVSKVLYSGPGQTLSEHSIELTFKSDSYFATLKYLKRLEGLRWQIFWDHLKYQVDKYPVATISIKVHSLGYEYLEGVKNDE